MCSDCLGVYSKFTFFTALHGMQTRLAMRILSVRLSDKHVHFDKTEDISVQIFYTLRKII